MLEAAIQQVAIFLIWAPKVPLASKTTTEHPTCAHNQLTVAMSGAAQHPDAVFEL